MVGTADDVVPPTAEVTATGVAIHPAAGVPVAGVIEVVEGRPRITPCLPVSQARCSRVNICVTGAPVAISSA